MMIATTASHGILMHEILGILIYTLFYVVPLFSLMFENASANSRKKNQLRKCKWYVYIHYEVDVLEGFNPFFSPPDQSFFKFCLQLCKQNPNLLQNMMPYVLSSFKMYGK